MPEFRTSSITARRRALAMLLGRSGDDFEALDASTLTLELADKLIENVVGVLGVPVGIGLNLRVNDVDRLIPMAIEEPSVVAAMSHGAKLARPSGGFHAEADPSHMIAQIQLSAANEADAARAIALLEEHHEVLRATARRSARSMERHGGGLRRLEFRTLFDANGPPMVVVHVIVDVADAMGANHVNAVAEELAPALQRVTGLDVNLRILSNLASERLARASTAIPVDDVGGERIARRIADADRFAHLDAHRAATHNKGILNGIDAVALATGGDWRAIEAGAHAWAARDGQYRGLTRWTVSDGVLLGAIELPLAVGTVGGATEVHPTVKLLRDLMGVQSARELACVMASVGLAQNLAALRALVDEGIQQGHMRLHARRKR